MADFVSLPIKDGVGSVHLNRFRISMYPPPGDPEAADRIGRYLFSTMVRYMDARTASVEGTRPVGTAGLTVDGVSKI